MFPERATWRLFPRYPTQIPVAAPPPTVAPYAGMPRSFISTDSKLEKFNPGGFGSKSVVDAIIVSAGGFQLARMQALPDGFPAGSFSVQRKAAWPVWLNVGPACSWPELGGVITSIVPPGGAGMVVFAITVYWGYTARSTAIGGPGGTFRSANAPKAPPWDRPYGCGSPKIVVPRTESPIAIVGTRLARRTKAAWPGPLGPITVVNVV